MLAFQDLAADLRFTFRLFAKNVSVTAIALLSLALGIGASSAIFSLIYAVLIDPYPYKNSNRILAPTYTDKLGHDGTLNQTSRKSDTQATAEAERGVCFFMARVTSAAS
jgi:hypothetical protein